MGLDQFVFRAPYDENDEEAMPLLTFRKENWLNAAIETLLGEEVENCTPVEISRAQIEELIAKISTVLKDHDQAPVLLPTQRGFFFGGTEYDEWYFKGLHRVRYDFAHLLDGNAEASFVYYIWW